MLGSGKTMGPCSKAWVALFVAGLSAPWVASAAGTGQLPDSGITKQQCYRQGSDVLVRCRSAAALALNPAQDGMLGLDVTNPAPKNGKLGFNYTKIGADGSKLPAGATEWACVKDNITGLMWEVKTADGGLRDFNHTYTNHGDKSDGDASTFVVAVNAARLCGKRGWRLPTVDELQGLVDYGVEYNTGKPMIDGVYFRNTVAGTYWTSSPVVGDSYDAWNVYFGYGGVISVNRYNSHGHVRLVR